MVVPVCRKKLQNWWHFWHRIARLPFTVQTTSLTVARCQQSEPQVKSPNRRQLASCTSDELRPSIEFRLVPRKNRKSPFAQDGHNLAAAALYESNPRRAVLCLPVRTITPPQAAIPVRASCTPRERVLDYFYSAGQSFASTPATACNEHQIQPCCANYRALTSMDH